MGRDATSEELRSTLEHLSDRAVPGCERLTIGTWRLRAGLGATDRAKGVGFDAVHRYRYRTAPDR